MTPEKIIKSWIDFDHTHESVENMIERVEDELKEKLVQTLNDVSLDGQHEDVWKYHELIIKKIKEYHYSN